MISFQKVQHLGDAALVVIHTNDELKAYAASIEAKAKIADGTYSADALAAGVLAVDDYATMYRRTDVTNQYDSDGVPKDVLEKMYTLLNGVVIPSSKTGGWSLLAAGIGIAGGVVVGTLLGTFLGRATKTCRSY